MQEGSFIWGHLEKQHRAVSKWIDRVWLIVLLLGALLLFSINLGGLPLQDWDEGTLAQVAREIWSAPPDSMRWLYPTLGGEPYHHKPPLMHWLIAGAYSLGGVNEWTTRLPGSILTAISVPLLYCIGRELFRQRWAAIYSALIYLTMLPVVRHGRLAILDGAVVSFLMVMMLCVLRSRRDLRYCLGIGIGFGLICLTQGLLGLLLGAVVIVFLFWDTPRLLTNYYLWVAIFIGVLPVAAWYSAQLIHYGYSFIQVGLINQSLSRMGTIAESKSAQPWYYILEILKWTWPWLVFLPQTLRLIWENRNLSWAKLLLVWSSVYLLIISCMGTKLPWYIFPIYPSLALAFGAQLAETENLPIFSSYPRTWVAGLSILAVVASAGSIYFSRGSEPTTDLQLIFAAVALTMTLAAILAERGDGQFLKILFWGSYISLLLLMKSNYWAWELWEAYPVKPVAAMISRAEPTVRKIYTSFPYHRPSLDFYSDRTIIPATVGELQYYWHYTAQPYFLLNVSDIKKLQLESMKLIDQAQDWTLITKDTNRL
ncbi:MAG: glycosyltransferase family 39 protein [Trichormus sp. ATA11-4-KO1]|jgi:4-amino-4-deoxy-L-arabinose transferase-like glycosyltransferase|nr:glycosyltransferase family 39 protein [Trichormus sp. ATA11-4-KO1]